MNPKTILRTIRLLQQHQLLPPTDVNAELVPNEPSPDNLLPLLYHAWRRGPGTECHCTARRFLARLEPLLDRGAALTYGVPGARHDQVELSVGQRLVFWPRGIPPADGIGIVSSRLGRSLEKHRQWFAALRDICQQIKQDGDALIMAKGTTTDPFLRRCSELFEIPLVRFTVARTGDTVASWFERDVDAKTSRDGPDTLAWPGRVSPLLVAEHQLAGPVRDSLVINSSRTIIVLRMRARGNVQRLTRQRLETGNSGSDISLVVGPDLVPEALAATFAGIHRWRAPPSPHRAAMPDGPKTLEEPSAILSLREIAPGEYLTHCTRHAAGPWPDQTADDYRDSLILDRDDADHGPLATLARIARDRRLLATGRTIRGGIEVVCFTSVPLEQIGSLRTFRAHRGRWDFEPYGACIRRCWLQGQGARPVVYGDKELWNELEESQRPFFQLRNSGTRNQIDWAIEREWRHVGDVDLTQAPPDSVWLFVPTLEEAQWLSARSPWPVVVLTSRE